MIIKILCFNKWILNRSKKHKHTGISALSNLNEHLVYSGLFMFLRIPGQMTKICNPQQKKKSKKSVACSRQKNCALNCHEHARRNFCKFEIIWFTDAGIWPVLFLILLWNKWTLHKKIRLLKEVVKSGRNRDSNSYCYSYIAMKRSNETNQFGRGREIHI